ncbi:16S rRNA (cytosine(967)-C(5))-methyltransferase RsmB [Lactobacillus sp. Sy-1]|uniref:16S rRNA (cytosine(967)-C(5))-methyltransferase RsmB n=1 Tax=Lactobacillus sp. Sy-1 TaxID=2109645 RepID=UPI001C5A263D|nr:16S rRNA (cytosine(967)-C(5))-methyltransferase RsmB [Lactobacillus sp. Sy-1]MBW1605631.1 16S rRNA (cytosine(967)-C(5))-methyltransferase RsmB [Lactobacillus sp. Sy-1]
MTKTDNPRQLAVSTLTKIEQGAYSSLQLNQIIQNSNIEERDVNLLTNIVYGVLQHKLTLEYQIAPFIKNPKKVQPWVLVLLKTALYQMEYLDRIPTRAIFNESINIAKVMGHDGIRKMVTGVLHQIDRSGLPSIDKIKDPLERMQVQFSVPSWIIKQLVDQVGTTKTTHILASLNQPAKQSVRINTAEVSRDQLVSQLNQAGFTVHDSQLATDGLILTERSANSAAEFKNGELTIQDESAMLPVETMPIQPHQLILDACSAPGGKTTQIAEKLAQLGSGQVIALDLHESRLKQVVKNAKRMHLNDYVQTKALDARKLATVYADATFDQVLVDAPCSGLGLMRRKPEIRYEKSIQDIQHLAQIQLAILDSIAPKIKTGGQLTYSTCTIIDQENHDVLVQFLTAHPEFKMQPIELGSVGSKAGEVRIYPDDFDSDGFFVANLVKTGD